MVPTPKDVKDNFVFSVPQGPENLIKLSEVGIAASGPDAKTLSETYPNRMMFFPEQTLAGSSDVGMKIEEIYPALDSPIPLITPHSIGQEVFEVNFTFKTEDVASPNSSSPRRQQRIAFVLDGAIGIQISAAQEAAGSNGNGVLPSRTWAAGSNSFTIRMRGLNGVVRFSPFRYAGICGAGLSTFRGGYFTTYQEVGNLTNYPANTSRKGFFGDDSGNGGTNDGASAQLYANSVGVTWNNVAYFNTSSRLFEFRTYLVKHDITLKSSTEVDFSIKANCVMRVV